MQHFFLDLTWTVFLIFIVASVWSLIDTLLLLLRTIRIWWVKRTDPSKARYLREKMHFNLIYP